MGWRRGRCCASWWRAEVWVRLLVGTSSLGWHWLANCCGWCCDCVFGGACVMVLMSWSLFYWTWLLVAAVVLLKLLGCGRCRITCCFECGWCLLLWVLLLRSQLLVHSMLLFWMWLVFVVIAGVVVVVGVCTVFAMAGDLCWCSRCLHGCCWCLGAC